MGQVCLNPILYLSITKKCMPCILWFLSNLWQLFHLSRTKRKTLSKIYNKMQILTVDISSNCCKCKNSFLFFKNDLVHLHRSSGFTILISIPWMDYTCEYGRLRGVGWWQGRTTPRQTRRERWTPDVEYTRAEPGKSI